MFKELFLSVSDEDKTAAIERIICHSSPRNDFFLMAGLSIAMAAFGVVLDSVVVLIGSMLIAPILYPLLSLALGVILADDNIITRSAYTVLKSVALGIGAGFVIGLAFATSSLDNIAIVGVIKTGAPSLTYAIVAAIAGFAAAFAMAKKSLNATLPGVAISVALVPPLAVAGIGLSHFDWPVFWGALVLFGANVAGVIFAAMVVFSMLRLAVKQKVAAIAVKEDENEIKWQTASIEAKREEEEKEMAA